jgi:mRNA-degrading endonuclease RelE of RelBE toxin-antitoxin system
VITIWIGKQRRVSWEQDSAGRYRGKEYFDQLNDKDRAKFEPLFKRLSDELQIYNDTRFRKEIDGIFCLKSGHHRLASFFDSSDLLIISGFQKKTRRDRRSARALETAVRLRDEYFERKRESP